ncbi:hypothetical protein FB451DRAFT_1194133 [Mycena latifolia]|nr:hypothetical protein FB451DRAFT_1194133 [Mycena latifolia]
MATQSSLFPRSTGVTARREWPTGFVRLQSEEDLEVSKISNIEVLTELAGATTAFQLDNTGSVTALRARVKAHIDSHEDLMGDPDYRPLFSPTQRRRYPAYPAPWGGIDATPSTPGDQSDEDDDADDDDLDEADETPPGTVNQPSSDLQALKSLPSTTLAEVLDLFIQNKVSTPFIQASFFQV